MQNLRLIIPGTFSVSPFLPEIIGVDELLELAYKEAKERGANGIANYEAKVETHVEISHGMAITHIEAYIVRGFLINIQD